jgi:hypothetical protein
VSLEQIFLIKKSEVQDKRNIAEGQMKLNYFNSFAVKSDREIYNEAIDLLIAEGGKDFYSYVERLGLADQPDLIVLSAEHHYYYDSEEMRGVSTLVNLKELNQIKNIKAFFDSFLSYLPQKSNFVGCFTDNEKINGYELKYRSSDDNKKGKDSIEHGIFSSFPFVNMLYSLLDSRIYNYMSRAKIAQMIEGYGFKIIDMTEVSGLTYFHSQKSDTVYN